MPELHLRTMTPREFAIFRTRLVRDYAAEHVRAGNWSVEESEILAAEQTDHLLPLGLDTPGILLLVAETPEGDPVGHVWVALDRRPGSGGGAWIYDIEVASDRRGQGYGRALLQAAENETARRGVSAIGLNVFGSNAVARRLYESSGYGVTTMQLRKELRTPG
jgi:ribosomal protein S18 acetylase RimI-like enzyme